MTFLDPQEYGKVAVLMGGVSAEREISLQSGAAVLAALQRKGIDAVAVDAANNVIEQLQKGGFSRVFNMLHGRMGEDGVIQGAIEVLGMTYTGSGVLASALGMDKLRTKEIWLANDLPTPRFRVLMAKADLQSAANYLGFPMFIKPSREGSSIGIAKACNLSELLEAWRSAVEFDDRVMAEECVLGEEYTATVLGRDMLPLIRLDTPNNFYDYEAKYETNTTNYYCPSGLDEGSEKKFQVLCKKAFDVIDGYGWGRVDFMVDAAGLPWLIEVNTLPGMTDHSLVPMAAKQAGIEFDDLVLKILETSNSRSADGGFDGC